MDPEEPKTSRQLMPRDSPLKLNVYIYSIYFKPFAETFPYYLPDMEKEHLPSRELLMFSELNHFGLFQI